MTTPSDVEASKEEEAEGGSPVLAPPAVGRQGPLPLAPQEIPSQWLARLECL
ncbi:UNVERIFIED_CONTAM: hypothetical protein Sangu_1015300 [Sesamum angustifolium]|uniref:Uncharacterized protein n=1 Tax=Sesamum angustifolium TaxID=2727405 RepID=A0AAW2PGM8_9LAMI